MGNNERFDLMIVGSGVSGSFIAERAAAAGLRTLLLEAGRGYETGHYPDNELDANSQLYWGGGIELNHDASIGLLRPKVVGGGSIVNQALLDRFDELAFSDWRDVSGVDFLSREHLDPWYDKVAEKISIRTVDEKYRNGNAEIFRSGFVANGYQSAPLVRAQRDCRFQDGNSCIVCLAGCPIESKQSMPFTTLRRAREHGLEVESECEVRRLEEAPDSVVLHAETSHGEQRSFRGARVCLAAGAIGNSALLLRSGYGDQLPTLGERFFTHPQYMTLARYDKVIDAFRGPMQSYKSDDPGFRRSGFKLENVFAPPVSIAMLLPHAGRRQMELMRQVRNLACIEVAVRDTNPGRITVGRSGNIKVTKKLNREDVDRREKGRAAIRNIFRATGAREIIDGNIGIGLHLMGGCGIGVDSARSVVNPEFKVHGSERVFAADSSIFPSAPGINPSFTIMALSMMAADGIISEAT